MTLDLFLVTVCSILVALSIAGAWAITEITRMLDQTAQLVAQQRAQLRDVVVRLDAEPTPRERELQGLARTVSREKVPCRLIALDGSSRDAEARVGPTGEPVPLIRPHGELRRIFARTTQDDQGVWLYVERL
jgi:hypothetical protein